MTQQVEKQFISVVSIIKDMIANRELFISLKPPFALDFEITKEALTPRIESAEINETEFSSVSDQICSILQAILEGEDESFVDRYIRRLQEEEGIKEEKEIQARRALISEKISLVKKELYDEDLKDRYKLKRSCKAPAFTTIDWDIKVKTKDFKVGDIELPYATFKITFQRNFEEDPWSLFSGRTFDSVQINFSKEEVEYVAEIFRRVGRYLEEKQRRLK